MTFIDAAVAVLKGTKEPRTTEVIERAIEKGLVGTSVRTPEASMSAAPYREAALPHSRVRKVSSPGPSRARRGSVRWTLAGR